MSPSLSGSSSNPKNVGLSLDLTRHLRILIMIMSYFVYFDQTAKFKMRNNRYC